MSRCLKFLSVLFIIVLLSGCSSTNIEELKYDVLLYNYRVDKIEENYKSNSLFMLELEQSVYSFFMNNESINADYFLSLSDYNNFIFVQDEVELICRQENISDIKLDLKMYPMLKEKTGKVEVFAMLNINNIKTIFMTFEIAKNHVNSFSYEKG